MAEGQSHRDVQAHIASIARRSHSDVQILTDALQGGSCPGGGSARIEPVALVWLRRGRPDGPTPLFPVCECTSGRCLVCN